MYPRFSGSSSSMIKEAYSSARSLSFERLFAEALSKINSCTSSLVIRPSSLLSALFVLNVMTRYKLRKRVKERKWMNDNHSYMSKKIWSRASKLWSEIFNQNSWSSSMLILEILNPFLLANASNILSANSFESTIPVTNSNIT